MASSSSLPALPFLIISSQYKARNSALNAVLIVVLHKVSNASLSAYPTENLLVKELKIDQLRRNMYTHTSTNWDSLAKQTATCPKSLVWSSITFPTSSCSNLENEKQNKLRIILNRESKSTNICGVLSIASLLAIASSVSFIHVLHWESTCCTQTTIITSPYHNYTNDWVLWQIQNFKFGSTIDN